MANNEADGKMPILDAVLGRFDRESKNPYFGMNEPGWQWPEERSFARTANVYAIARLTQVLCGLQGYVLRGGDAADAAISYRIPPDQRQEYAEAIAKTVKCLVEICPEILSAEPVTVPGRSDLGPYVADDRMGAVLENTLRRGGLIEDNSPNE